MVINEQECLPSIEADSRLCVVSEVSDARLYFCRHQVDVTTPVKNVKKKQLD